MSSYDRRRRRTRRIIIAVAAVAVLGAIGIVTTVVILFVPRDSSTADFTKGTGPGSIVSARTMPNLPVKLKVLRIQGRSISYHSTGPDGKETTVTGTVFSPHGNPPKGGWPLIVYAHGTTGIDRECAPSLKSDLGGGYDLAAGFVGAGYAFAIPDYQGLGGPGVHPYLDSQVEGHNVIDAARATRAVFPDVSKRWVAVGTSQGAAASWAANEQSKAYAPELDIVGSASLAPPADIRGFLKKSEDGTLTRDQAAALQAILETRARLDPQIDLDQFRSPAAAKVWDLLSSCSGATGTERTAAVDALQPGDIAPRTATAKRQLAAILDEMNLPKNEAAAPMLVIYGTEDTFIDAPWTTAAIARARRLGDQIEADEQQGKGHDTIDITRLTPWIIERFGKP